MSISNGVVGGEDVNSHLAKEISSFGMAGIVNKNFECIRFRHAVVTLATVAN